MDKEKQILIVWSQKEQAIEPRTFCLWGVIGICTIIAWKSNSLLSVAAGPIDFKQKVCKELSW